MLLLLSFLKSTTYISFPFNSTWSISSSGKSWSTIFSTVSCSGFHLFVLSVHILKEFSSLYFNHWFNILQYWLYPWLCPNNIWILPLYVLCLYSFNLSNFVFISPCLLTRSLLILVQSLDLYFISCFIENTKPILSIYLHFW